MMLNASCVLLLVSDRAFHWVLLWTQSGEITVDNSSEDSSPFLGRMACCMYGVNILQPHTLWLQYAVYPLSVGVVDNFLLHLRSCKPNIAFIKEDNQKLRVNKV